MTITLNALQKQRRDTASNWTSNNPTLLAGEWGIESDTKKFKIGDGTTAWQSLDYVPIPDTNRLLTGDLTISGSLTVNGTTTTIDTTNLDIEDKNITLGKVSSPSDTTADGGGFTLKGASDKTFNWVNSTDSWTSSEHIDLASGKVLKVAGTEVLSATNFTGTSAVATAVTVADESTDTSCNVLFATAATGNLPPKTGTNLTFNSSSGALTATSFVGALTGNVTGNASGSAGSCTGNAATATALATARAINGVDFDGTGAITVTAAGSTLTGTSLKSTIVSSSLTSVGTLTSLASGAITTTDNLSVDNAKEVRLYEADSNGSAYVGIKGATDKGSEASYTVSLPAAAPTANQILKANASTPTDLEWATDSGGIPDTGGTFTGKVTHNYTSSLTIPSGNTAQRDGSPAVGMLRHNSTLNQFEGYNDGAWGAIGGDNSTTSTIADESSDTTCFPLFATAATGDLGLKSGSNLTFNSANGTLAATAFSGDGSALTGISAGATGGGSDEVFVETGQTVTTSYTLSTNKNAVTVSPSINSGVTITVPSGATLVIL